MLLCNNMRLVYVHACLHIVLHSQLKTFSQLNVVSEGM